MKKHISIFIAILLALALMGCSSGTSTNTTGNTTTNSTGSGTGTGTGGLKDKTVEGYTVKVIYDGKELKAYTIEDIKKMTMTSLDVAGSTEAGPSVDYILRDNNINDYSKITFTGVLKDASTLTKEQVSEGAVLDITNHDTVKLAAKAVAKSTWAKDIVTIEILK